MSEFERAEPYNVTEPELAVIDMVRRNKAERREEVKRKWSLGRLEVAFHWRSRRSLWGRFGGGYNWKFGIEAGSWRSFALLLFVCRLSFWLRRKEAD